VPRAAPENPHVAAILESACGKNCRVEKRRLKDIAGLV